MTDHIDRGAEIAIRALNSDDLDKAEHLIANRKTMIDELRRNRQFFLEIIHGKYVDNYITYISDILCTIFLHKPETLKSSDKVELSRVLQFDNLDDFVQSEAKRKVDSLSYRSISDLQSFFTDRFNVELIPSKSEPLVVEAIEIRNISVHNRCIINERFCTRTGCNVDSIGEVRSLDIDTVEKYSDFFFESVSELDLTVRRKFKISGKKFGSLID